ncbi:MAG: hypothetical protein ACE5DS_00130 [Kiloniellaceae bacterium]
MKAFIVGTLAAIAIAVIAGVALNSLGLSTADVYSTASVRR